MPKFVSKERVPVTIEGDPNTIYIKPKMDYGTRNRVSGAAARITREIHGNAASGEARSEFDIGAYQIALLVHNVVGWAGPDFDGIECVPENIMALDPDDALLERVLGEINDRNTRKAEDEGTSPNLSTNGRSPTTKAKAEPAAA